MPARTPIAIMLAASALLGWTLPGDAKGTVASFSWRADRVTPSDYADNRIDPQGDAVVAHARQGVEIVRKLDGIIKNKYANHPGVLAEWISASHVERAPRRRKVSEPPSAQPSGQ